MSASFILCGFRSGSGTEPKFLTGSISRGFSLAPSSRPPSITGLRGNSALLCPRPSGRCRSSLPPSQCRFPAGCGPGKRPAPAAPPVPPAPFVPRNRVRGGRFPRCPGGSACTGPGFPSLRPCTELGAAGDSSHSDSDCWKPRKVTPLEAFPRLRPLFFNVCKIKGRGCMYLCICTYVSI